MNYPDDFKLEPGEKVIHEVSRIERSLRNRRGRVLLKKGVLVLTNQRILFFADGSNLNFVLPYKSIVGVKRSGFNWLWMAGFIVMFNTVVDKEDSRHRSFSMTPFAMRVDQFFRFPIKHNAMELEQVIAFLQKAKDGEFIEKEYEQFQATSSVKLTIAMPNLIIRILFVLFLSAGISFLVLSLFDVSMGMSFLIGLVISPLFIIRELKKEEII